MSKVLSALSIAVVALLFSTSSILAQDAVIENTGPGSTNEIIVGGPEDCEPGQEYRYDEQESSGSCADIICDVDNNTNIDIDNDTDQDATTGDAGVDGNTTGGSGTTGDAGNDNNTDIDISVDNNGCDDGEEDNGDTPVTPGENGGNGSGQVDGTTDQPEVASLADTAIDTRLSTFIGLSALTAGVAVAVRFGGRFISSLQ
jgi:hypothetical protein